MVHEIASILVAAGHETQFEQAVAQAKPLFLSAKGCHSIALHRAVENPRQYTLVVEWETVEDHLVGFRESEAFKEWRGLIGPHVEQAPQVHHETQVL
jgi:heme-degrading monooxygenase HmoA